MVDAYAASGSPTKALEYLSALQTEADEKGISLGHESTTAILNSLKRASGEGSLEIAYKLHTDSHTAGRPCAPAPSLGLSSQLLKAGRFDDSANVLLRMARPPTHKTWAVRDVSMRLKRLATSAQTLETGSAEHASLMALLEQVRERYELPESVITEAPPPRVYTPPEEPPAATAADAPLEYEHELPPKP